jgi:hypothetical protein
LVFSPLTRNAFSSNSGSMNRFVAMCQPPHMSLHKTACIDNYVFLGSRARFVGVTNHQGDRIRPAGRRCRIRNHAVGDSSLVREGEMSCEDTLLSADVFDGA